MPWKLIFSKLFTATVKPLNSFEKLRVSVHFEKIEKSLILLQNNGYDICTAKILCKVDGTKHSIVYLVNNDRQEIFVKKIVCNTN